MANLFNKLNHTVVLRVGFKTTFNTFAGSLLLTIFVLFSIFSFLEESEILFSIFVPIRIYNNADSDKSRILTDLKGKAGIFMWTHIETGTIYIGSAIDLSKRFYQYYSFSYLKKTDNYIPPTGGLLFFTLILLFLYPRKVAWILRVYLKKKHEY